jgi:hypothetical protein
MNHEKPHVEYREWRQGVTAVFADISSVTQKPDETFYRVTSETDVEKVNTYLPSRITVTVRDKKKLQRYVIMSANAAKVKTKPISTVISSSSHLLWMISDDNVLMTIYGNKVAYIDFNTETSIIDRKCPWSLSFKRKFSNSPIMRSKNNTHSILDLLRTCARNVPAKVA